MLGPAVAGGHAVSEEAYGPRLERVENDVSSVKQDVGELKNGFTRVQADVRGLGGILERIERGVSEAQQQWQDEKHAARLNPVAMGSVLLTIISILVGGSWLISGEIARQDERSIHLQRAVEKTDREIELQGDRQWQLRGGRNGSTSAQSS
jgi:hypothetical protein